MTASVGWFAMCERAFIDVDSNNISLVECVEQIQADAYPTMLPLLTFVIYLYRGQPTEQAEYPVRIVAEPPGRPEVQIASAMAVFQANDLRLRMRFASDGFKFLTHGRYFFRLDLDTGQGWQEKARLPLMALRPGDPAEGASPSSTGQAT